MHFVCSSDDGDRYDSDSERDPREKERDKKAKEYKDTDSMDSFDRKEKPARTRTTPKIVKKVDLGAAANYGKEISEVRL